RSIPTRDSRPSKTSQLSTHTSSNLNPVPQPCVEALGFTGLAHTLLEPIVALRAAPDWGQVRQQRTAHTLPLSVGVYTCVRTRLSQSRELRPSHAIRLRS